MTSAMMAAGSLKVGVVHFGRHGVTGAYLGPSPKDVMRSNREAMLDVCRTRGARMRRHPSASAYVSLAGSNQCSSSSLGSPRTHSPANLLVLSKLCQLLIACRDIQQIALVLRPGHLLGLNTNLFCALAPVLGIMKGGHVRLLQVAYDE